MPTEVLSEGQSYKSGFIVDMLKLVSGTTFAQAVGILVAPLLTRFYGPEAFGITAVFTSVVSVIGVVACLRYELAIMLPEDDESAAYIMNVSVILAVIVSLFSALFVWFGRDLLINALHVPGLKPYLWLIPIAVLGTGIFLAFNYWNTRTRKFGRLSFSRISNSVTTTVVQLGGGYIGITSAFGLILAFTSSLLVSTSILVLQSWVEYAKVFLLGFQWKGMLSGVIRYKKFPLYDSWGALLNSISWQLPAFLLTAYFSVTITGYYSLANRLLGLPMGLIGAALAQVFFQRAAQAKIDGTLPILAEDVFRRLVSFGIFPLLVLSVIGKELFSIVFGANWAEAGVYAQILSIWTFFWFISSPMSTLFSVLERQGYFLAINLAIFLTRLIALVAGGILGNPRAALFFFASTGILVYGYESLAILAASGVPWIKTLKILYRYLLISVVPMFILMLMKWKGISSWILVGTGVVFIGLYLLLILLYDTESFSSQRFRKGFIVQQIFFKRKETDK